MGRRLIFIHPSFTNEYSCQFNGTDEYIVVTDDADLDFGTSDFSVSFWMKTSFTGTARAIISKQQGSLASQPGWAIFHNFVAFDGKLFARINDGTATVASDASGTSVSTGAWLNVIVVFDRNANMSFYVNDSAYGTPISIAGAANSVNNAINLNIGNRNAGTMYYSGLGDEFALWDKALDSTDRTAIYNGGTPADLLIHPSSANLKFWMRFTAADITSFPTIADYSGFGNNGTNVNGESGDIQNDVP